MREAYVRDMFYMAIRSASYGKALNQCFQMYIDYLRKIFGKNFVESILAGKCPCCGKTLNAVHLQKCDGLRTAVYIATQIVVSKRMNNGMYQCPFCGQKFSSLTMLGKHMREKHGFWY